MRDGKKRLWWSVGCFMAVCLEAAAVDAATLGSGTGWQAPWETVTSGDLTLSVNATGGAALKTADGWTLRNYGDPEKTAYSVVASIGVRSNSLQQLRKVNGIWHSRISVSVR